MLHAVRYVKTSGGLDRMLDTAGGAQWDHFVHGTHEMSARIAAELGERGPGPSSPASSGRGMPWRCRRRTVWWSSTRHHRRRRPSGWTWTSPRAAHRIPAVGAALAARSADQVPTPLTPPRFGGPRDCPVRHCPTRTGVHHLRRQPPAVGAQRPGDRLRRAAQRPGIGCGRGPGILLGFTDPRHFDRLDPAQRREQALGVSPRCSATRPAAPRFHRSALGRRDFRTGRPDRRGAARFVDAIRSAAAHAGRPAALGGHRDRRRVDRLHGRRGAIGTARGRRGGQVARRSSGGTPR